MLMAKGKINPMKKLKGKSKGKMELIIGKNGIYSPEGMWRKRRRFRMRII
jgi:hypothetical protein